MITKKHLIRNFILTRVMNFAAVAVSQDQNIGKTGLIIKSIAHWIQAKTHVNGDVEITYTNNSPDNLKFLWLQLDQNIYKKDSRASATTTETGGRWANAKFTDGDVIKSISVEYNGKTFTPKYEC